MTSTRATLAKMHAGPPMRLQLLGPPRLLRDGQVLHVGSRKALAMLAVIALEAGVSRVRLAGWLWPEVDAAGARRNLRRELFRLRKLGVAIAEAADGALSVDPALAVDALQLSREDAVPASEASAFEGLDGVGSEELDAWLRRWREQLARRRLQLLDEGASASEQRGDLAAALALQERRWAGDLTSESAALAVIRLRAALGDPVGALQDYQRHADALRQELDLAPSESARALALELRAVVGTSTGVEGTQATRVVAKAAIAIPANIPFVARDAVQRQIAAAWSRGQRVYLHGPAGTGKTRVSSELASQRGAWLRVACEPQDAELPYSSVVRLLRALREAAPDVTLPGWMSRELSQLMPELGEPPAMLATDEARQRLLTAVAAAWSLLIHDNFNAIVLDDWHWGDSASVGFWAGLEDAGPAATPSPAVAWIIAYRSAQLPAAAAARQQADIESGRGVGIGLAGLAEEEVLALTNRLSGAAGGQLFSQRLHAATEGNPFFLLETLRFLFERGLLVAGADGWSTPFDAVTSDYAELPVPPSVRTVVLGRVRSLGEPVRRLLELASLHSGGIEPRLLVDSGAADEQAVVEALERAEEAQLIVDAGNGWRFAHDLVRQSLANDLSSGRRRWMHEQLANRLTRLDGPPALIAAHWESAQVPATAVQWRVAAAEAALRVHAVHEAIGNYERALADGAQGAAAAAIHLACSRLHARHADRQAADASLDAAAEALAVDPAASDDDRLRLQLARVDHLRVTDRVPAALELLDALSDDLARAGAAEQAHALRARAGSLMGQGRHNDAQVLMDQALDLLEGLPGQREALASLLLHAAMAAYRRGDLPAFAKLSRRAVAANEGIASPSGLSTALMMLGAFLLEGGDHDEAHAVHERSRAISRAAGDVPSHRSAIFGLVKLAFHRNDVELAGVLLDEGEALAPRFENADMEQKFVAARYYLQRLRNESAAATATATRLLDLVDRDGGPLERIGFRHLVVDAYLLEGDLARARPLIAEAQALCDVQDAGGEGNYYAPQQAVKQARLALAEGHPRDALAALPQETALSVTADRFGRSWIGCAAALALGDVDAAARYLESVDIDADVDNGTRALWLEQRLAFDAARGHGGSTALQRAEELLGQGRIPVMVAERLQQAVDRARLPAAR